MTAKKSKRSILPIGVAIVVVFAIIGAIGGNNDDAQNQQDATQTEATQAGSQADEQQTEVPQPEGFDFSTYGTMFNCDEEAALESLRSDGLEYGGQRIAFDGIVSIEGRTVISDPGTESQKESNGVQIWVGFELDGNSDRSVIITNAAMQAAALQKVTDKEVILQVKVPNPEKPGYVMEAASISYDVLHPAPDSPADIETMLASSAWWTLEDKSSSEGDSIDELGL